MTTAVSSTQSPFTFETQDFLWPGEMWSIEFRLPSIMSRALASEWIAFNLALRGSFGRFLMGDPSAKLPQGSVSGPGAVDGNYQQGRVLNVKNLTPNVSGILKKGDYLQVGAGFTARLHMVLEDADTDSAGRTSLIIAPELRYAPADNSAVIFHNPVGLFMKTDNSFSWAVDTGKVYRLGFTAVEVVGSNA
ncbi:hypothetical protein [Larkinella harenae]